MSILHTIKASISKNIFFFILNENKLLGAYNVSDIIIGLN